MNRFVLSIMLLFFPVRLIAFSPSPKDGEAAITSAPVMLVTSSETGPTLEDTRWKLSEYLNESGDLQLVISDTVIDAQFADGKVSGSAGCNRYFGGYTSGQKNQLVFDGRMGATQYTLAADRLELRDSKGSLQVIFSSPAALK